MRALVCAMLPLVLVGCKLVPDFHCGLPRNYLQHIEFFSAGLYSQQCPERLAYPWLLDESDETNDLIDHMTMDFGALPVSKDGNIYADHPPHTAEPDRAPITHGGITFFELAYQCRAGQGCRPGPLAGVGAELAGFVENAGIVWRWFVRTPAWYPGTGVEWLEYERIPRPLTSDGQIHSLLTYQHVDAQGQCWRQFFVGGFCVSDDQTDDGLLP